MPWDGKFVTPRYKEVLRVVRSYDRDTTARLGYSLLEPSKRPAEDTLPHEHKAIIDKSSGCLLTFLGECVRGHCDAVVQTDDLETQLYRGYIALDRLFKWKPVSTVDAQAAD